MNQLEKMKKASAFSSWFPKALKELNEHYQKNGCEGCHALLVEAKVKLGVKYNASGGEKEI